MDEDWYLASLADVVEDLGSTIGVTLTVGGVVISGDLAPGKQYFEEVAKGFADAWRASLEAQGHPKAEAASEDVRKSLASGARFYGKEASEPEAVKMLHLKDARVFPHGRGKASPENGTWIRIQLSRVDAWALGSLEETARDNG